MRVCALNLTLQLSYQACSARRVAIKKVLSVSYRRITNTRVILAVEAASGVVFNRQTRTDEAAERQERVSLDGLMLHE